MAQKKKKPHPDTGKSGFRKLSRSMIVYKKGKSFDMKHDVIIRLEVPRGATVYSFSTYGKHRATSAKVLSIAKLYDGCSLRRARSLYNNSFIYNVGKYVRPFFKFNMNADECADGIHFFKKRESAANYCF